MCENWGFFHRGEGWRDAAAETGERRRASPRGSRDKETHVRDRERGTVKSERGQPSILPSSCIHVQQTGLSHTLGGSVCCRDTEPYSLVMNPAFSQNAWNLTSPFNTFRVKWTCYGAPGQKWAVCPEWQKPPQTWSLRLMSPRDTGTNQGSILKTFSQLYSFRNMQCAHFIKHPIFTF